VANPQVENGHVDIANEIIEQLCRCPLSGQEWRILMFILRKTWGWKKKSDKISLSQFSKATGIERRRCQKVLMSLVELGVVKKDDTTPTTYLFNKDYEQWQMSLKKTTVVKKTPKVSSKKTNTKETSTKENISTSFVEDSVEYRLALYLYQKIQENKPDFKKPNLQEWARHIDLMIRRDGREPMRIGEVIEWCQQDEFWHKNILSTSKLRKQFDQLEMKMQGSARKAMMQGSNLDVLRGFMSGNG
jgi:phage replication O-like protein O